MEEVDDDDDEATDEDEFVRWMLLRGMKILETSSEFIGVDPDVPPLLAVHPNLREGRLGGEATAVMEKMRRPSSRQRSVCSTDQ